MYFLSVTHFLMTQRRHSLSFLVRGQVNLLICLKMYHQQGNHQGKTANLFQLFQCDDFSTLKTEFSDVDLITVNFHSASRNSETLGMESWKRQLELAITWNRVDLAETEIFTEESQWKVGLPVLQLTGIPTPAARQG